jgi:hypothetical protein
MLHEQRMTSLVLVLFIPLCTKWHRSSKFRMKARFSVSNYLSYKYYFFKWQIYIDIHFLLQLECLPSRKQQQQQKNPSKYWWGCEEKETPISSFVECKLVQPLCKSLWRSLKKNSKQDFHMIQFWVYTQRDPSQLCHKNVACKHRTMLYYAIQSTFECHWISAFEEVHDGWVQVL